MGPPTVTHKTSTFPRPTYTVEQCTQELQAAKPKEAKDKVLWQYRLSAEAMRQGQYAEAKRQLDDALVSVGAIMTKVKGAEDARGLFNGEAKKTFLGEPYERVMAYYYRGILYWMDGEPDNARACFLNAQFQDSDTFEKQYSSDYALLDFLDALSMAKLGNDSTDALKRAKEHDTNKGLPEFTQKANVLVFFELGNGPLKYSTGQYKEQLRFASANARINEIYVNGQLSSKNLSDPQPSDRPSVILTANGQSRCIVPADDTYFQATTRGGRTMDHINANKAVFKKTTDTVGNVAMTTGAAVAGVGALSGSRDAGFVGLGILAAGLIAKGIAAAANPAADIRCWDNLPQYLALDTLQLPPGKQELAIEFRDSSGGITNKKTINIEVLDGKKDTVVFITDR